MLPDPAELVDRRAGADVGEVLDRHVAAQRRMRPKMTSLADVAVVRDVHVGHEDVAVADRGHAAAAARAAVDGDELAEDVAAADDQPRFLAAELQVLRDQADRRERIDLGVVADLGPAVDDRRRADPAIGADADVGADRRRAARSSCLRRSGRAGGRSRSDGSRSDRARRRAPARLRRRAGRRRRRPPAPAPATLRRGPSEISSRSRSPGTTCRRNLALLTPRR